jgi:hypothetical protein
MGQDNPAVKPLLLAFGEGAVFKKLPDSVVVPVWLFDHTSHMKFMPTRFDVVSKSKTFATTGYDFLMNCFLRKPMGAFSKKASIVYICLDRGSPANKIIEQDLRNVGVVPMETPANYRDSPALLNDFKMPDFKCKDDWKSFVGNPQLYRRAIHYLTMRMIGTRGDIDEELRTYVQDTNPADYDDDLNDFTIDCQSDKTLFLHGGRLRNPDPDRPLAFKYPEPFLLEFKTITEEIPFVRTRDNGNVRGSFSKPLANCRYDIKRSVKINKAYDPAVINNLLEGEVAALYYAQPHIERGDGVMIVTPDLDVLMMLLLSCPDRIDPSTGKFVCRVFVHLVVSTEEYSRYVDVHQLWFNIHSSRPLKSMKRSESSGRYRSKSSNEYVSKICAMCLLCGTDYVKNYCLGITNRKGGLDENSIEKLLGKNLDDRSSDKIASIVRSNLESLKQVPWIIHTFLKYYDEFEEMITVSRCREYDLLMRLRACSKVDIDETLFIRFTRQVYVEHYTASPSKHAKQFEKKYGTDVTVENVKRYLYEDKIEKMNDKMAAQRRQEERMKKPGAKIPKTLVTVNETKAMATIKRNRLPPPRKIRVICRHLLWQMEYMLNGYKYNCSVIDPTTLYLELPYYGWFLSSGKCKAAGRVSLKRPNVEISKKNCVMNRRFVTLRAVASEELKSLQNDEFIVERNSDVSVEEEKEEEEEEEEGLLSSL